MNSPVTLGIDIGGTKIAAGLVSSAGVVLEYQSVPTPHGASAILAAAQSMSIALVAGRSIGGVGVGAGGQIDPQTGIVRFATEVIPGWTGADIRTPLQKAFGVAVAVDNDVNALAAGEYRFGAARGARVAMFLALGTGVGGALIIDGVLYRGAHFGGAEFGRVLIPVENAISRSAAEGMEGTLESYASGSGLVRTYIELGGAGALVSAREIGEMAKSDSGGIAAQAIRRTGQLLGVGLASIAAVVDPDKIIIGGGLSEIGETLLNPAREEFRRRVMGPSRSCRIVLASLGTQSSVVGAASLAMA